MESNTSFNQFKDEVRGLSEKTVEKHLSAREYNAEDVQKQTNEITKDIVEQVQKHARHFKFSVTCTII
jgi:hypothetical protein